MDLDELSRKIIEIRRKAGKSTPSSLNSTEERDLILGKLMLIVNNISSASNEVIYNDQKYFKLKLADIVLDVLEICGSLNITEIEKLLEKRVEHEEQVLRKFIVQRSFCSL